MTSTVSKLTASAPQPKTRLLAVLRFTRWGPGNQPVPSPAATAPHSRDLRSAEVPLASHRTSTPPPTLDAGAGPGSDEEAPTDRAAAVAGGAAAAAAAMTAAVRRQLHTPGCVSPQDQIRLILADRNAHQHEPCPPHLHGVRPPIIDQRSYPALARPRTIPVTW